VADRVVDVHGGAPRTEGRLRKNDRLIVADSVVDDHRRGAQQTEGTRLRNNDRSWLIAWMSTEVLSGLRVGCAKVTVADCCIYDDLRSFFGMALKSCPKVCMY
jgi:hypothetical protein